MSWMWSTTTSARPLVRFNRRARVRSADSVIAGVSSMSIGSEATSRDTWTNLSKSRCEMSPRRIRSLETCDSSLSRRVANCSALISSENTATVAFDRAFGSAARASASSALAALTATLVASDVLPMPGRPARITRSDGCSPPILASRSCSPVVRPDTWPARLNARSAPWIASISARSRVTKPPATAPSVASWNSECSAASICCAPSSSASAPNALLTTVSPMSMSCRRSQASWTARPYSPALMMPTIAVRSCARYAVPPTSSSTPECSNSAFRVTASASWPASMRRRIAWKMRPWIGSAKCSGARNSETRS